MIIVHVVEPFASGVAVFVRSLTETLQDDLHIIIHGERKWVMDAKTVKRKFLNKNVRFLRWKSARRSINLVTDTRALAELYVILKRLKSKKMADAVHLHSSKSGILGRVACKMAGIQNVFYTPNGAPFLSASNKISRFFYERVEKVGYRLGGKIICCSASELKEYLKLGVHAQYISNSVSISNTNSPAKESRSKFRIVTSGRVETQKNPILFNAIASYFEEFRQLEFIWIGDGEDKKYFTAENILVTGWLNDAAVYELVSSADMYLSTSLYEGLSFGALEALALKKPMLLTDCTGNVDLVKKGINGSLYTTDKEAIIKILQYFNNREMLEIMGSYSEEISRTEFNIGENYRSYKDLYAGGKSENRFANAKWSFSY